MKPNILIVMTDQQSASMMSCSGNKYLNTPNLDGLADRGVRFSQCVSANPVCIPSRFALFTGHMPLDMGLRDNIFEHLDECPQSILDDGMAHYFNKIGYKTVYGGKEHLPGFNSTHLGFEYICKDERYELADTISKFVSIKHEKPFLAVASLINPHDICLQAIDELGTDELSVILKNKLRLEVDTVHEMLIDDPGVEGYPPLPKNHKPQSDEPEIMNELLEQRNFRIKARNAWTDEDWRRHRYVYARLTERVDAQIGTILNALYNGPNASDTLVIFTSDHGDHDSSHKMEHKTVLYREAVEVPFLISWPNVLAGGSIVDATINNGLDLIPTLLDAVGIEKPDHLKGMSILPLAKGDIDTLRKYTPVECEIGKAMWSGDYAYCRYDHGRNAEQLYDFNSDYWQTRNAIKDNADIVDIMGKAYDDFWS